MYHPANLKFQFNIESCAATKHFLMVLDCGVARGLNQFLILYKFSKLPFQCGRTHQILCKSDLTSQPKQSRLPKTKIQLIKKASEIIYRLNCLTRQQHFANLYISDRECVCVLFKLRNQDGRYDGARAKFNVGKVKWRTIKSRRTR